MRINAHNGALYGAGVHDRQVQFHIGAHRYTATPREAIEFARQLLAAAEIAEGETR